MSEWHLHVDDQPQAIAILDAVVRDRDVPGYRRTAEGRWVDWEALEGSFLSDSEVAAVLIAGGICRIPPGGLPPHVRDVAVDALKIASR